MFFFPNLHHFSVSPSEFSENSEGDKGDRVLGISQRPPQRLHQFGPHGLDMLVEKVGLEVVDAQFQSPQALRDESLRSVERGDEGIHQHRQVREQRGQSDRHRQAEFDEQILHVLLVETALKTVQALQQIREQGQELLVEQIVASASDGPKESAEKQKVVVRVFGSFGQLHGFVDDGVEMRFQHLLVFLREEGNGPEHQFKQLQIEIGPEQR